MSLESRSLVRIAEGKTLILSSLKTRKKEQKVASFAKVVTNFFKVFSQSNTSRKKVARLWPTSLVCNPKTKVEQGLRLNSAIKIFKKEKGMRGAKGKGASDLFQC